MLGRITGSHGPPWESISRVLLAPVCITTLERGNESKNSLHTQVSACKLLLTVTAYDVWLVA